MISKTTIIGGKKKMDEKILYYVLNSAFIFAKFFFVLVWIYISVVVVFGGEWKIFIGDTENGIRVGFEGIIPSVVKLFNFVKGLF